MKPKVLYLAPHLSTGGMPSFLLKTIELLNNDIDIYVIEYHCYSLEYVVQRNKIIDILKEKFFSLKDNKKELFTIIKNVSPDIIHLHEPSERFDKEIMNKLFSNKRKYKLIETFHDVNFNPDNEKLYYPDAYAFCTPYHFDTFINMISDKYLIEFPIDDFKIPEIVKIQAQKKLKMNFCKFNIVNVGLWTPGKNQKEMLELAKTLPNYMFHFIGNLAENFKFYWEPLLKNIPENVVIHGEKNNVEEYINAADLFMFNSVNECNPLVLKEAISKHKKIIARNLPQYKNMFSKYINILDETNLKNQTINVLLKENKNYKIEKELSSNNFKTKSLNMYKTVKDKKIIKNDLKDYKIINHYVDSPYLEIIGTSDAEFKIHFLNNQNELVYEKIIKCNNWVKLNLNYYHKWTVKVFQNEVLVYENILDLENKNVFICFESNSLGDTIAWMPYVEEFRKKHNCNLILSTFKNELFENNYKEIKFVTPGTSVNNLYALYRIGWFYNNNKEPELPNTIPLQKTATNILGLNYNEIKPKIVKNNLLKNNKLITIATNSTSGCKLWTKENWQIIINYLHNKGYTVKNVSLEENIFDNCISMSKCSLEEAKNEIEQSVLFIGLSSGLSWLAWALETPVIMISNFSEKFHEFTCIRPINTNVCHGCWNNLNFKFDKGDWNWCPINKNTENQFICQKSITPEMIIKAIPLKN